MVVGWHVQLCLECLYAESLHVECCQGRCKGFYVLQAMMLIIAA